MLKWTGEIFVLSKMHCIQFCFGGVPSWAYVSVCSMQFSVNDVANQSREQLSKCTSLKLKACVSITVGLRHSSCTAQNMGFDFSGGGTETAYV
jgi:hypothetical protein